MNKVKERQECDTLSDEAIIELYWKRNENAIAETDKKYKRYLYHITYYTIKWTARSVLTILIWEPGAPFRPSALLFFRRFYQK